MEFPLEVGCRQSPCIVYSLNVEYLPSPCPRWLTHLHLNTTTPWYSYKRNRIRYSARFRRESWRIFLEILAFHSRLTLPPLHHSDQKNTAPPRIIDLHFEDSLQLTHFISMPTFPSKPIHKTLQAQKRDVFFLQVFNAFWAVLSQRSKIAQKQQCFETSWKTGKQKSGNLTQGLMSRLRLAHITHIATFVWLK